MPVDSATRNSGTSFHSHTQLRTTSMQSLAAKHTPGSSDSRVTDAVCHTFAQNTWVNSATHNTGSSLHSQSVSLTCAHTHTHTHTLSLSLSLSLTHSHTHTRITNAYYMVPGVLWEWGWGSVSTHNNLMERVRRRQVHAWGGCRGEGVSTGVWGGVGGHGRGHC